MNKVKKILILSDTHGDETLYKQIIKNEEADIVIHAGDYSDTKSRLSFDKNDFISNVDYYIEGNHGIKNENFELIQEIKDNKNEKEQFYFSKFSEDYKIFEINGKCFFLVHVYISEDDD
jgi:predicted phosphodiesterase